MIKLKDATQGLLLQKCCLNFLMCISFAAASSLSLSCTSKQAKEEEAPTTTDGLSDASLAEDSVETIAKNGKRDSTESLAEEELADDLVENELEATPAEAEQNRQSPSPSAQAASQRPVPANDDSAAAPAQIYNIKYVSYEHGGTVVIEGSRPLNYHLKENPELKQVIVEIANARLPEKLKRPFVTKDFQQNLASLNSYQDLGTGVVRVVLQMNHSQEVSVQKEENKLLVLTSRPDASLVDAGTTSEDIDQMKESDYENELSQEESALGSRGKSTYTKTKTITEDFDLNSTHFTGKKISIEVGDTDIREVLNLLAEQSGANLIVDEGVSGKITLKLREVPWDQALVLILRSKNLGFSREGSIIRVATQERFAKEETENRKVIEERLNAEELKTKVIPVSYAKVKDLVEKVRSVMSARGKIVADEETTALVVTDVGASIDRANKLIRALDLPPRQVLIEGKVVEARDNFQKDVGLNLSLSGSNFSLGGQQQLLGGISNSPISSGATTSGLNINLTAGTFDNLGDLTAFLGLYESQEKIKVLSSPRIVTLNNKEAEIKQITQIPVPTITIGAPGQPAIQGVTFKDVALSLKVEPQITFEGNVILKTHVKREFAGATASNGQREINSREANTFVLVPNGQTAVIGGVYQSDSIEGDRGTPFLKDIPIIGNLFKYHQERVQKNELLIFLTPRILSSKSLDADAKSGGPTL